MTMFGSPRAQIARLQQEIREMQQAQNRERQQLEQDFQQRIRDMEERFSRDIRRQARETEAQYTRRLQQLQSDLLNKHREEIERLEEFDRQAQMRLQEKLGELNRLNQALQEQMQRIISDTARKQEVERRAAEEEYHLAEISLARCESTAHAFFLPGQLELHRSQAGRAMQMITGGLYSAAMATAVSVCTDVDILILNVQQMEQEWLRLLTDYERRVGRLRANLSSFVKERHETVYTRQQGTEGHLLDEPLLSYWSSGLYGPLRDEIEQAAALLEEIRKNGATRYLQQEGAMTKRMLTNRISRCRELEDRLTALITCVRSELRLSDERFVAGEMAADTLDRLGYMVKDQGFEIRDGMEQPLDAYVVEAELTDDASIRIAFSPIRQHGVAIRNECVITITLGKLQEASVYRSLVNVWTGRIRGFLEAGGIDPMPIGDRSVQPPQQQAANDPSPETYARRIAMRY